MNIKIPQNKINTIIKLYQNGKSQKDISELFNVSQSAIYKILKKNKIKTRRSGAYRKYVINEKFFNKWSANMAYILGFITADGNVFKDTLSIKIHKKDIEILQFITNNIGNVPIERIKNKYIRIRFNSKQITKSLLKYNIKPNKSLSIKIDFKIPKKYIGDYIRGLSDGDGSIWKRKYGLSFALYSGSEKFIKSIHQLLNGLGNFRKRDYSRSKNRHDQWYISIQNNDQIIQLRKFIYNQNFSLKRKRDRFFSI